MGQKIVITANMNNKTPRIARKDVVYQWHWHRIGTVAGVGAFAIGALWYAAFTPAIAEQSRVSESEIAASQLVADPVASVEEPGDVEQPKVVEQALVGESLEKPEVLAQDANQAVSEVATEVATKVATKATPETPPLSGSAQSEVEPAEVAVVAEVNQANEGTAEPSQAESIRTEPVQAEPTLAAADFNDEAKVANLAQGSKIDTDKVSRAVLTTQVQDREPVSALGREIAMDDFDDRLVFFTELRGLQGQQVSHIWYFEQQQVARVELGVHTARYRTFSSKRIMPSQAGLWRVELRDNNNKLLATREFRLIAKP
ncbi:DUF2914 domain-containing protein [Pseudoalteromonas sp. BDTF-M6]|uniref:DUF2914 domain-containing protein n=1 Tax=Pseudoalteromonas sp. BDTF-M6 TaxID=2796132 RepID=UPI001BAF3B62|nr:DUF2914 domain-containing protein [Pseudoalteromonas sp. BDTF-M6]MBS3799333.1 DUF2914 domain-containing protein [Pseudoalteromonas sp. BDTF-M6]